MLKKIIRQAKALAKAGRLAEAHALLETLKRQLRSAAASSAETLLFARCQQLRAEGGRCRDRGDEAGGDRRMTEILSATEKLLPRTATAATIRFQAFVSLARYEEAFALGEEILDLPLTPQLIMGFWHPWAAHDPYDFRDRHVTVLTRLIRNPKTKYWALFYRACLLNSPAAFAFLRRIPARRRYGWMHGRAAWASLQNCRFEESFRLFRIALRFNPREWRTHALMAEGYICLGKTEKALACMRRAEKIAPADEAPQAMAWTGQNLLWLERYEPALAVLEKACRRGAGWAFCWRGAAKLRLGRVKESLDDFDQALTLNPHDHEASLWRGEAYRLLGRHEESLRDLSREPVYIWARLNRALVYDAMGDCARMRLEFDLLPRDITHFLLHRAGGGHIDNDETKRLLLRTGLEMGPRFRTNRYRYMGANWRSLRAARPEGLAVEVQRDDARVSQEQGQRRRPRRESGR